MFTQPALLLRFEEFGILLATLTLYYSLHFSWLLFAVLFLAPDLFMFGYLVNTHFGAAFYNMGHALFVPLALLAVALLQHWSLPSKLALIWIAHIAFDRLLGYGLKYPTTFKDTHLQRIS